MVRIVQHTLDETIDELRQSIQGMEEKYDCDSETMLANIKGG